jgi:hypothetical protein
MTNETATRSMPSVLIQRGPYLSEKSPETGP